PHPRHHREPWDRRRARTPRPTGAAGVAETIREPCALAQTVPRPRAPRAARPPTRDTTANPREPL
ncbi:hypothetical protein, partial [Microbacterium testaceum]|uniref:hypothetical protein n=1 Tax=Microbacterium testaceum TaxID=2033 RepID=UPI003F7DE9D1